MAGHTVCLRAIYDSGNTLKDLFSGAPVIVCAYEALAGLFPASFAQDCVDFFASTSTSLSSPLPSSTSPAFAAEREAVKGEENGLFASLPGMRLILSRTVTGSRLIPAFFPD